MTSNDVFISSNSIIYWFFNWKILQLLPLSPPGTNFSFTCHITDEFTCCLFLTTSRQYRCPAPSRSPRGRADSPDSRSFHVDSPTPNWTRTIEQNNWAKNWLNKSQLIKKLTEHKSNDQTNNPTKINWSKSYWTMSQLIKFLAEQIAIEQLINWHLFSCQEGT